MSSVKLKKDALIKDIAIKLANNLSIENDLEYLNRNFCFMGTKYTKDDIKLTKSYIYAKKGK